MFKTYLIVQKFHLLPSLGTSFCHRKVKTVVPIGHWTLDSEQYHKPNSLDNKRNKIKKQLVMAKSGRCETFMI